MPSTAAPEPVTIGFAATGLHVIHIQEYCRAHDLELEHLMAQGAPWKPRTLQWVQSASSILGGPEVTVAELLMGPERHTLDDDFAIFDAMIDAHHGRPLRIVAGSLQVPFLWFLIERYIDRIDSLVLVDEGLSTYAGATGDRNKMPVVVQDLQRPELDRAFKTFADFPATCYSRFPLISQLGPNDTLEQVDRSVLPHLLRHDDLPTSPMIYFIGQSLQALIKDPSLDAALTSLAVHITRRLHPGAEVIYVPHRDEQPEKLEILTSLVDIRDLGYPIELEALVTGAAPRRLATFCSTAAISLGMIDRDVQVETLQLPEPLLKPSFVDSLKAIRDLFEELIGTQLIEHHIDTGVEHDGTFLMPPGLLDDFVSAHMPEPGAASRRHSPGWLPQIAYEELPFADVTVVLGHDGEESLQPAETALEQAEAMIEVARSLSPTGRVVYVPEPTESLEKRDHLGAIVEVERRVLPAELLPFEWGFRPRRLVTVRSSCFGALVSAGSIGWALRPDQTGYDLEETAIAEAHDSYRALATADIRWQTLRGPNVDHAESLLLAQRRHARDELVLRRRVAELEAKLEGAEHLNRTQHRLIGSLRRRLVRRAKRVTVLQGKVRRLESRNRQLKAAVARVDQSRAHRWSPRRVSARVRRRLRSIRAS